MTDQITIINELGQDADLLLESDEYLENQHKLLATELSKISGQFDKVNRAIKFKRRLQNTNDVAVRIIERDEFGNMIDVSLQIMSLPDAVAIGQSEQHRIWQLDGYDVQLAETLRAG